MGKVLSRFTNGFTGAVSRSIDNIVISMGNASGGEIPFGAPVFLQAAVKAPDTYGSDEATYAPGDAVDVLVRGSVILQFDGLALPGDSVYIRKADGALVTEAGGEGTTLKLPNVTVRTAADGGGRAEAVLTGRNIL